MRKFLTICAILLSLSASAQWQQTGSKVRYVNGIGIPTKDTAAGVSADSSQILIRPADSSLYVKYKRTWQKVGSGGGGTVTGSGTTNYVSKFTSSTAIGNSQIFDNGTSVGIGTTSPSNKVDIFTTNRTSLTAVGSGLNVNYNGSTTGQFATLGFSWNSSVGNNSTQWGMGMIGTNFVSGNADVNFFTDGVERMRITSAGGVGIDYTAPAAKLAVNGTALINTNTDNGVDKLQVSGSMNVSARATAQNLSVTNNGSITNDLTVGKTVYCGSSSVDGLVITAANTRGLVINGVGSGGGGASQTRLSFDHNGADRGLFYYDESAELFSFQTSGTSRKLQMATEAGVFLYATGSNTNVRIGDGTAANAKLSVAGTTLVNTNTDNGVDELQVNGSISGIGFKQNYVTKTGAYTATNDDYVIDCTSGTFTVTLPASSGRTGRILIIKNSGAGTITVDGNASETIDGATTYSLSVQYATVQIMSDGTNWKIISKF
jgi:hypothetical protein